MSTDHRTQIFFEDKFIDGKPCWGWQCFTCRDEQTGFGNATTAQEAADLHEEMP